MMEEPALTPPRAILFDWDNTLADNWAAIHAAMNATLTAMAQPSWTLQQSRERIKGSLRESFPMWFGDRWREAGRIYRDAFEREHLLHLREMPDAGAMLAVLQQLDLYLAVVSNKMGRYLRIEADHLGWTGHFGRLVGAQDTEVDKPAVEPVELALADSGVARGPNVWFVGDTDIDMICAVNAGCTPILLRAEPPGGGEFVACCPAQHVKGCLNLADLVTQLRVSQSAEL
jgi:phosphoglycolate phosphatase